jgi:hypothetical protein
MNTRKFSDKLGSYTVWQCYSNWRLPVPVLADCLEKLSCLANCISALQIPKNSYLDTAWQCYRNWLLHADCLEKLSCLANCIRASLIPTNSYLDTAWQCYRNWRLHADYQFVSWYRTGTVLRCCRNWRLHADCLEKLSCLANFISASLIPKNSYHDTVWQCYRNWRLHADLTGEAVLSC